MGNCTKKYRNELPGIPSFILSRNLIYTVTPFIVLDYLRLMNLKLNSQKKRNAKAKIHVQAIANY